jgi:hypothetical protein
MITGILIASSVSPIEKLLAPRGSNVYPSGIHANDNSLVRYAPKSSDQPNIIITDPIYDGEGNSIVPGFYELTLAADRDKLILSQSEKIVAIIPVFKVEEERNKQPVAQPMDDKSQKKFDKAQKKLAKKNKKLMREGKIPTEAPEIYTHASINYDEAGDYYLIKYERGNIKAWGTMKSDNW